MNPTPSLLINGDFNFPFMLGWNSCDQASLLESVSARCGDGLQISKEKLQAKMLIELSDEFMLSQVVKTATHEEAILDLIFTNNEDLITNTSLEEHAKLSDHRTIISSLSISTSHQSSTKRVNFSSSKLAELDLRRLTDDDWAVINTNIVNADWSAESAEDLLGILINNTEVAVEAVVKEVSNQSPLTKEGTEFKSKNKIPRPIRTLLRRKRQLSKMIQSVDSPTRLDSLKVKLTNVEEALEANLIEKRLGKGLKKSIKLQTWSEQGGGGGPRNILCLNPIFYILYMTFKHKLHINMVKFKKNYLQRSVLVY